MGTGWRRAFCTRDRAVVDKDRESPRKCVKLGFLSGVGGSTPSTPRMQELSLDDSPNSLRCKTNITNQNAGYNNNNNNNNNNIDSPMLHCKTTMKCSSKSTPASPRSPFAILKNSFRLHKNNCGVCLESVKTGQGKAIFTAECAHSFHFPCISAHVRKLGALVCPLCKSTWKHVPLLAFHNSQPKHSLNLNNNNNNNNNQPKPYSDDEPLKSPRGGLGFLPIPEADDEGEEFQGFFVDPVRPNTDGGHLRNFTFEILPEVALVSVGRSHETYALVLKIKAPPTPPAEAAQKTDQQARAVQAHPAPVDLVTVLDVSDSMTGAKLEMMKRAVRLVVSSLGPSDRLSILSFSADPPARLLPLRRMTPQGQLSARRIVDRLVTSRSRGRGQSLAEALASASQVLEDRRERNPVATIMLLSDGHDEKVHVSGSNHNRRRGSGSASASASTRFAHMEIPVGSGDKFARCVSGFLSVVAQDLTVEIGFSTGEISAVYSCNGRPTVLDPKTVRIGDLYAEEEREFLVEVRVPTPLIGSHHILSVRSTYRNPSDGKTINGQDRALLVPRPTRSPIGRLRSLFVATRASAEARRLIENDEVASAQQLLASSRALLMQSGSGDEFVRGLEAELAEIEWMREKQMKTIQRRREGVVTSDENGEPLTPTSAWRAAEQLAKVAQIKKSMNRVGDLHGFENARF